ncbi:MAG: TIGR02453 family protein, partial [Myxococcota bacterium]
MPEPHFSPALFKFLRDLEKNNNREWFQTHKPRFEEHVKAPLLRFIEDIEAPLMKVSKHIVADPSPSGGSMFRIYRDVRFSKDKRPYKTHAAAQFRHATGKDAHAPGYYMH